MANEDNPNFNSLEDVNFIVTNVTVEEDPTGNVMREEVTFDRDMIQLGAARDYVVRQSRVEETPVYAAATRESVAAQVRQRLQGFVGQNMSDPEVHARVTAEAKSMLEELLPPTAVVSVRPYGLGIGGDPTFRSEYQGIFMNQGSWTIPDANEVEDGFLADNLEAAERASSPSSTRAERMALVPLPSAIAPERPQPNTLSQEEVAAATTRSSEDGWEAAYEQVLEEARFPWRHARPAGPPRALTAEEIEALRNITTIEPRTEPPPGRVSYAPITFTRGALPDISMGARVPHRPCPLCGEAEPHEHHRDSLATPVTREDIQRLSAQVLSQPLVPADLVAARQLLERDQERAINLVEEANARELFDGMARAYQEAVVNAPPVMLPDYAESDIVFTNRVLRGFPPNTRGAEGPAETADDCEVCGLSEGHGHSQEACDDEMLRGEDAVGIPREHQCAASNRARERRALREEADTQRTLGVDMAREFQRALRGSGARLPTGRILLQQYRGRNIQVEIREMAENSLWTTPDVALHLRAWLDNAVLDNPPYRVGLTEVQFELFRRYLLERGQTDGFHSFTISAGEPIKPAPLDAALAFRNVKWPVEDSYEEPSAVRPTEEEAHIKQAEYDLNIKEGLFRSITGTFGNRRPPNLGRLRSKKVTGKPELSLDLIIEIRRRVDSAYAELDAHRYQGAAVWHSYSEAFTNERLALTSFDAWTVWREEIHQALKHLTREQRAGDEGSYLLTNIIIHTLERRAAELQLEE